MGIYDTDEDIRRARDAEDARKWRNRNNPTNQPTGAYTGRCSKCGSNDLWDDASMYGCNACGAMFSN